MVLHSERLTSSAVHIGAHVDNSATAIFGDLRAFAISVINLNAVDRREVESAFMAEADACLSIIEIETLADHARVKVWRDAYRTMGLKAAMYRSSVEQLIRRSRQNGIVHTGNWLTDLYNRISIVECAPMGGYDVGSIGSSEIVIRTIKPGDRFEPLGGSAEKFPLSPRVVGYIAGNDILCWALNHRDSMRSALFPDSSSALFFSESVDEDGAESSRRALDSLRTVLAGAGANSSGVFELGNV
jgi:DNA/RNA-binding domain of Phe-tRNA-synthetase-like protein